jgi:hypothetical protein
MVEICMGGFGWHLGQVSRLLWIALPPQLQPQEADLGRELGWELGSWVYMNMVTVSTASSSLGVLGQGILGQGVGA